MRAACRCRPTWRATPALGYTVAESRVMPGPGRGQRAGEQGRRPEGDHDRADRPARASRSTSQRDVLLDVGGRLRDASCPITCAVARDASRRSSVSRELRATSTVARAQRRGARRTRRAGRGRPDGARPAAAPPQLQAAPTARSTSTPTELAAGAARAAPCRSTCRRRSRSTRAASPRRWRSRRQRTGRRGDGGATAAVRHRRRARHRQRRADDLGDRAAPRPRARARRASARPAGTRS